jgi:MFS family permease
VPVGGVAGAIAMPLLVHAGGIGLVLAVAAALVAATGTWFALVTPAEAHRERHGFAVRRIWHTPGIRRLLVVAALYITVLQALLIYLVPASREAGLTAFAAGAAYLVLNVTAAVARIVWGRIADRAAGARRVRTLVETGIVAAAGAALFALALHLGPVAVLAATIVFGFGALGWNGIVYLNAGELASAPLAGQAFALVATLVFVLSALAAPPLGALADTAGWDALWLTTAAIALAGAYVAAGLGRPSSSQPDASAPGSRTPDSAPSRDRSPSGSRS